MGVGLYYQKFDFGETDSEISARTRWEKYRKLRLDELRNAGELTTVKESIGEYNGSHYLPFRMGSNLTGTILNERKMSRIDMTEKSSEDIVTLQSADDAFDANRENEDDTLKAAADDLEEDYQYHSYSLG